MISIKDNRLRWGISAVLALLILFGTYRNVFSLAAFLVCGLMLVFCDRETNLLQIFFVMPMANIFKFSPNVQSFFTIILLVYVILHLVLPRRATMFVILFAVYVVIGELFTGQFNLFRTVKLICNILFLSSIMNDKVKLRHNELFFSYIAGNLVSSVFGLMDSPYFKIVNYIGVEEFSNTEMEIEVLRFTGLYSDPNYYTVGMIVSLCLLIILYYKNEINLFVMGLLFAPIIYFLILTYSKSAILMLMFTFLFLLYVLFQKRKFVTALFLIMFVTAVVILAISGAIPMFEVVVSRIMAADTGTEIEVNTLTTGRFNLWVSYAKYIIFNLKTLVFGDGITANLLNGRAAHNTYLDIFFHLGIVGEILLFASLKSILVQDSQKKMKRNVMNYSVLICVVVMYFFLSELFYFDPPFHLFFMFTVFNLSFKKVSLKSKKQTEDGELTNEHVRIQKITRSSS